MFSMASNQQQANPQFPFCIGTGGVYKGGGQPNLSDTQAGRRFQPMGFHVGQTKSQLQPQPPNVTWAAGFQQ